MIVKLDKEVKLKFAKNELNKKFPPIGMFTNSCKISHNNDWYNCYPHFAGNKLRIRNIMKVDEKTYTVIENIKDFYYEKEVSKFKKNLINFLLNGHTINDRISYFKKGLYDRRKTIFVFLLAIVLSIGYYLANIYTSNTVMDWLSNNLFAQTILMFLTLSGFINIFTPFTIQKEITEKSVEDLATKKYKEQQKLDEQNKRIEDAAKL